MIWPLRNQELIRKSHNRKLQSEWIDHPAKLGKSPRRYEQPESFPILDRSPIDVLPRILIQNLHGIYRVLDFDHSNYIRPKKTLDILNLVWSPWRLRRWTLGAEPLEYRL